MSLHPEPVPYGEWPSPIGSDWLVADAVRIGQIRTHGETCYWVESRPEEKGRGVLVKWTRPEGRRDLTPPGFSVRSRAHEYGGGDFAVCGHDVVFSRHEDQRLYLQAEGAQPAPLTPDGPWRYADGVFDAPRRRLLCIMEDHGRSGEPQNLVVAVNLQQPGPALPLLRGHDFYSSPRLDAEASRLAWLCWDHPRMPWDGTELWVGRVGADGAVRDARRVAGGEDESVFQPEWGPDGALYFVSDRTGWWNLYRWNGDAVQPVCTGPAEMGLPQWVFGMATYAFPTAGCVAVARHEAGIWRLSRVDLVSGHEERVGISHSEISAVHALPGCVVLAAGGPSESLSIVGYDLAARRSFVLRRSNPLHLDADATSFPQSVEFPTRDGSTAQAFFYRPAHPECVAPPDARPPLLVRCHGGPTSAAATAFEPRVQYWTSRGFALLDVNYRGSTGFGRAYRRRLDGQWGLLDVTDCLDAAQHLVDQSQVDERRLLISGSSAGGFTVLCALAFHKMFAGGASYYGISDLEALLRDTHKFEARYLDRLVGPYPARRDLYLDRSPLHGVDRFSCPVVFFQGGEDLVVPPNQTERMVAALARRGVAVGCLLFPEEGHGFRRAENIRAAIEGELYFYSVILGLNLPEEIEPIDISNPPR